MRLFFSKSLLLPLFGFIFFSCSTGVYEDQLINSNPKSNSNRSSNIQNNSNTVDSIQVKLQVKQIENDYFNFLIKMNMFGDSWIVSPLEKEYPYGEMTIDFDKNDHFVLLDSINETPNSIYKSDPLWKNEYKIIKGETDLKQKIRLLSITDFEVTGHIFFMLEPICKPYEIEFEISNKSGKITVKQME